MTMGSLSQLPGARELPSNQQQANNNLGALPVPTGPFHVGKVVVHVTDKSRIEPLSSNHDFRELMVDIWYPADPSPGEPAAYLDVSAFLNALGSDGFKQQLGEASDAIKRGVPTHAVLNAPFARSSTSTTRKAPLLVFSPGGGLVPEIYTAQMENLASHGYIVAAICHPYDAIRSTGRGGYNVILRRQGTSHMDFTDLPLLGAHDIAERRSRNLALNAIETYTLGFFDKFVRGRTTPLLESALRPPNDFVETVKTFPPAHSPYYRN